MQSQYNVLKDLRPVYKICHGEGRIGNKERSPHPKVMADIILGHTLLPIFCLTKSYN